MLKRNRPAKAETSPATHNQLSSADFGDAGTQAAQAAEQALFPDGTIDIFAAAVEIEDLEQTMPAQGGKVMGHEMSPEAVRLLIARLDESGTKPTRSFLFELAPGLMFVELVDGQRRIGMFDAGSDRSNVHTHVQRALDSGIAHSDSALDPLMPMQPVGETRAAAADLARIFAGMTQTFAIQ